MRRLSILPFMLILLFSLFGFVKISEGATYYVNQDGSAAFTHIQSAISVATEDDLIIVEPGNYWEDILISGKTNLTIEALEESTVHTSTLNGVKDHLGLGMIKIINSKDIILKGFKISGNTNAPDHSIYVSSSTVTLINNTFNRQKKTALFAEKGANVEVIRNWFINNGTAVEVVNGQIKLVSNHLHHNTSFGIRINNNGKVFADHNTFFKNKGTAVFVGKKAILELFSNIFMNNGIAIKAPGSILSDYNLFYKNGRDFSGGVKKGSNDLFSDPKFQDPANNNFNLSADSPAIGKSKEGLDIGAVLAN